MRNRYYLKNEDRVKHGMNSALINIFLNVILAGVKIFSGIFGYSYALIADGVESLLDICSSTAVWGGLKIGSRPPDDNHPFGHGRAESLAAMMVSGILLAVAVGIAIQSIRGIVEPQRAPAAFTLFVLIGVIFLKEGMYRFLLKAGEKIGSLSLQADAWHSRSDALTSAAAFIGISIALIGGEGYESADGWAALFASVIIFINGGRILKAAVRDIMDAAVPAELEDQVRVIAGQGPGVLSIEKCRIRKSGLNFFVEIHIKVDGNISVTDGHQIAHRVKKTLCEADLLIADVLTHVEPV